MINAILQLIHIYSQNAYDQTMADTVDTYWSNMVSGQGGCVLDGTMTSVR